MSKFLTENSNESGGIRAFVARIGSMFKFLKKDSYVVGTILAIVLPVVTWAIVYFINRTVKNSVNQHYLTTFMTQILAIVPNVLLLRYYLINLKADKTGRAIVAVTFVIAAVLFIMNLNDDPLSRLMDHL
jgi:hypothetical protein